jgi:hypothetical protein
VIRIEVDNEADVTRMVAAFTTLPVLATEDYEIFLAGGFGPGGNAAMLRAWRRDGKRGATEPADREDEAEVSNDPRLRPEAISQAAAFVGNLYAIDVTFDGNRSVPLAEYARILLGDDNPLICTARTGGREDAFAWLFTEADIPEILELAAVMIERWTAAGEQWGVPGD